MNIGLKKYSKKFWGLKRSIFWVKISGFTNFGVKNVSFPETHTFTSGARRGFNEFRLVIIVTSSHVSLRTPNKRTKSLCLLFICQIGHLGIKKVHGFLGLIGLMEEASLDWSEFAKGFCTGVLGRTA